MKIIFRSMVLTALLLASSCGKDSPEVEIEQMEEETEQLEQTALEANTVSDNLLIAGSTKKDGIPPTPNGTLSFNVSNTTKTALPREGFYVTLNHDTEIVGAYIQVKTQDGALADKYFDVNIEANTSTSKKSIRTKKEKLVSSTHKEETETYLDVDLTAEIEGGKFCYEICVYDADGNISEPEEVCIKVESWAGNAEVIGKWTLEKWFYDYELERVYLLGENNCMDFEITRSCQGVPFEGIEYESCVLSEYWDLELKADGTYIEKEKQKYKTTYADISQNPCLEEAEHESYYTFESTGKWAYLDDEDKFVFVTYYDKEDSDGEVYEYTSQPGEDHIYYGFGNYEGEVKLVGDKLVVESYEETTVHFKK